MIDDLAGLYDEFFVWERSKRGFAPSPHPKSILGSLRGPTGGERPDADLDALMPYLRMALLSSDEHRPYIVAFHSPKGGRAPVKRLAQELGISRMTFYRKLPAARLAVYNIATRLKAADGKCIASWYKIDVTNTVADMIGLGCVEDSA